MIHKQSLNSNKRKSNNSTGNSGNSDSSRSNTRSNNNKNKGNNNCQKYYSKSQTHSGSAYSRGSTNSNFTPPFIPGPPGHPTGYPPGHPYGPQHSHTPAYIHPPPPPPHVSNMVYTNNHQGNPNPNPIAGLYGQAFAHANMHPPAPPPTSYSSQQMVGGMHHSPYSYPLPPQQHYPSQYSTAGYSQPQATYPQHQINPHSNPNPNHGIPYNPNQHAATNNSSTTITPRYSHPGL